MALIEVEGWFSMAYLADFVFAVLATMTEPLAWGLF